MRQRWIEALGLENLCVETLYKKNVVCTTHFRKSDYRNPLSKNLNSTAVPSIPADRETVLVEGICRDMDEICPIEYVDVPRPATAKFVVTHLPTSEASHKLGLAQRKLQKSLQINSFQQDAVLQLRPVKFARMRRKPEELDQEIRDIKKYIVENEYIVRNENEISAAPIDVEAEEPSPFVEYLDAPEHIEEAAATPDITVTSSEIFESASPIEIHIEKFFVDRFTQSDEIEPDVDEELQKILEKHPQFIEDSKLNLIKKVLDREEEIKELQAKLDKYSRTMAAFKSLINIE